jgi:hypothetical protein
MFLAAGVFYFMTNTNTIRATIMTPNQMPILFSSLTTLERSSAADIATAPDLVILGAAAILFTAGAAVFTAVAWGAPDVFTGVCLALL